MTKDDKIERLRTVIADVLSSLETLGEDGWSEAPYLLHECRTVLIQTKGKQQ